LVHLKNRFVRVIFSILLSFFIGFLFNGLMWFLDIDLYYGLFPVVVGTVLIYFYISDAIERNESQ